MAAIAQIQDGKIVESQSASSLAQSVKSSSGMDKDAFLGLLVAQMKYQDPLQPTSNTEFVAQYAQFSSLEQMQNMSATLELTRASSLVGQTVSVNTTDSYGKATTIEGKVDYVVYENNKAYVSIQESLFALDDVYGVADQAYLDATKLATEFNKAVSELPSYANISLDDAEAVIALATLYNGLSEYEQSFISSADVSTLEEYVKRIEALQKDYEDNNNADDKGTV
ncbi:MAG: flagellar hook capping protein [Lachnospiraceae bacterium]|nr:flagellar hook capping protein [Lachnospiraceae bacterium]